MLLSCWTTFSKRKLINFSHLILRSDFYKVHDELQNLEWQVSTRCTQSFLLDFKILQNFCIFSLICWIISNYELFHCSKDARLPEQLQRAMVRSRPAWASPQTSHFLSRRLRRRRVVRREPRWSLLTGRWGPARHSGRPRRSSSNLRPLSSWDTFRSGLGLTRGDLSCGVG